MSMSTLPTWSSRSEQDSSPGAGTSDHQPDTRVRNTSPWLLLFPVGAVLASAAVLLRKPAVRQAAGEVLRDPEVREVCKDAGENAYRVIAASWRRNGGPSGLADTFLR